MKLGLSSVSNRSTKLTSCNGQPFVSHQINLLFTLSLNRSISFASAPLAVLVAQHDMRYDTTPKEEQRKVRQHDPVAKPVKRFVCCTVDVAGHDAVQVAPSNDESKRDTAFVHAFGVVCAP
jgi:hypothetical protein